MSARMCVFISKIISRGPESKGVPLFTSSLRAPATFVAQRRQ